MITGFGFFRSFRESNGEPCIEINFTNNSDLDVFYQLTTCDGVNILMDLGPMETSINYCATNNSWEPLDPNITVNVIQDVCLNDGDTTSPAPSPSPAPAPAPAPSPSPSPSPRPNPKEIF